MAGRLGTVYGLIFGLVMVAAGSAALSPATNAESSGNRIAQGVPSVLAAPAQPDPQAQPARASSPAQEAPTPEQVEVIAQVQTCFAELGYYRGRSTASGAGRPGPPIGTSSTITVSTVTAICSPSPAARNSLRACIEIAAIDPPPGQGVEPAATNVAAEPELSQRAGCGRAMKVRVSISIACRTISSRCCAAPTAPSRSNAARRVPAVAARAQSKPARRAASR